MSQPVVRFDGVWKEFRRGDVHDSLRDLVPAALRRITGRAPRVRDGRTFWALRDLSFDIRPGEVLGIIGPNGAGKSTTLKLLNRIIEPTRGHALVHGKIGALIEVSAGFHPDLSGRQNVFLQGAIMGMRKNEISRKFDAIVDFAGVEDFIDTPVKRYSSGMNARLGFSIAAHLEPDVLIIDEVLAVGDHAVQTKAFARIKAMANAGAPVVLVSHQLDKVLEICTKAILLERGAIRTAGSPEECVNEYLHGHGEEGEQADEHEVGLSFSGITAIDGMTVRSGGEFAVRVHGVVRTVSMHPAYSLGIRVIEVASGRHRSVVVGHQRGHDLPREVGPFELRASMRMNLPPGAHYIDAFVFDSTTHVAALMGPRLQIEVLDGAAFWGDVQLDCNWDQTNA